MTPDALSARAIAKASTQYGGKAVATQLATTHYATFVAIKDIVACSCQHNPGYGSHDWICMIA